MKKITGLTLALFSVLILSIQTFAQSRRNDPDPTAACGAMGVMLIVWVVMMLVIVGILITIIVLIFKWIKKDAISRGIPNGGGMPWLALLGLLGLLIYVLQRPQGNTMPCHRCGATRMQGLQLCPHCGQP